MTCDQHPDPLECPDILIYYNPVTMSTHFPFEMAGHHIFLSDIVRGAESRLQNQNGTDGSMNLLQLASMSLIPKKSLLISKLTSGGNVA